jgi:ribosomal protein S18 acetylase RimI-like enzyme
MNRHRPLSLQSELIFAHFNSQVLEKDAYLVVKTPTNPNFHWGNFISFKNAPVNGDEVRWPEIFKKEFSDISDIKHRAFTWEEEKIGIAKSIFEENGYEFDINKVLAAEKVRVPAKMNQDGNISIRPVQTDNEWNQSLLNQLFANEGKYEEKGFLIFKKRQMDMYRRMSLAGRGHWFGAFNGSELAADLGIFFEGKIARYQSVVTHPDYRRKGICARLVYEAGLFAKKNYQVETLVMIADANYHAARIYESVGFKKVEDNFTLAKWWE